MSDERPPAPDAEPGSPSSGPPPPQAWYSGPAQYSVPYPPAQYPPAQYPPAQYPPAQYPPAPYPPGPYPGAQYPAAPPADGLQWRPPYPGSAYPGAPYPPGPPPQWAVAPPRPLSDQQPPPPPRRSGGAAAVLAVVGVALLGMIATLAYPYLDSMGLPDRRPAQSAAPTATGSGPSPTASGAPSPTPTATMPDDPTVLLRKNPIYKLAVPADCPDQTRPASKAAWRSQVKALVKCQNAAWKKALARTPVKFSSPDVEFYDTRTNSACGRLGDTFPAAYCGAEHTLYFSTAAYRQGRYYRLAVAQFVMHEYAHHVQQLAEISPSASDGPDERSAVTTRRIELQAHCIAHYQLTHSGIGFDNSDRADAEFQFTWTSDPTGHGSVTAERYWGRRGLNASTVGACNTWTVKAGKVK